MLSTLGDHQSAIAPVIGPLLGGQIVTIASWRAVFSAVDGSGFRNVYRALVVT